LNAFKVSNNKEFKQLATACSSTSINQINLDGSSYGDAITSKGISLKVKGKVYRACIQSVLGYASETWPMKVYDMARLEREWNE